MATPAVHVVGLAKRYGHNWALRGLDLTVAPGDAVALLGPNGSGKSTLIRILVTAARPTFGEVQVCGVPITDGDAVRRHVSILSDRPPVYSELTALENLKFAAAMYGLESSESELRDALAAVGLARAADARVGTFSQGMGQRLSLARATLQNPDLILLDEPYNALDAEGLRLVDQLLARVRAAGKTAILATHHIAKGLALCNRVIALQGGRVAFDGPTAAFAASPLAQEAGAWA
jgi:heme exporter protein A